MSHDWDKGCGGTCHRCGGYFSNLDDHRGVCTGKPSETIAEYVRYHGLVQVLKWANEAQARLHEEARKREAEEYMRKRDALQVKIDAGRQAEVELNNLEASRNRQAVPVGMDTEALGDLIKVSPVCTCDPTTKTVAWFCPVHGYGHRMAEAARNG